MSSSNKTTDDKRKSVNGVARKRGKHNKRRFHKRFVIVEKGVLNVYQTQSHHTAGHEAKHSVDLANKTIKAVKQLPTNVQNALCSCVSQFAERFFVKVMDSTTQKTEMMLEVADEKAAIAMGKALRG